MKTCDDVVAQTWCLECCDLFSVICNTHECQSQSTPHLLWESASQEMNALLAWLLDEIAILIRVNARLTSPMRGRVSVVVWARFRCFALDVTAAAVLASKFAFVSTIDSAVRLFHVD